MKDGYKVEPFGSEDTTMVVEVPVDVGEGIRTVGELSIWEQFSLGTKDIYRQPSKLYGLHSIPRKKVRKYHKY